MCTSNNNCFVFNGDMNLVPPTATHLMFPHAYNEQIDLLPHHITHLTFGDHYNQPIIFPKHLKSITFNGIFDQYINDLCELYELINTNISEINVVNHIDKNKHNLKMKLLMLWDTCLECQ